MKKVALPLLAALAAILGLGGVPASAQTFTQTPGSTASFKFIAPVGMPGDPGYQSGSFSVTVPGTLNATLGTLLGNGFVDSSTPNNAVLSLTSFQFTPNGGGSPTFLVGPGLGSINVSGNTVFIDVNIGGQPYQFQGDAPGPVDLTNSQKTTLSNSSLQAVPEASSVASFGLLLALGLLLAVCRRKVSARA